MIMAMAMITFKGTALITLTSTHSIPTRTELKL